MDRRLFEEWWTMDAKSAPNPKEYAWQAWQAAISNQSLSQKAVREEALSGIIDELAAIADACVDLQQNRKRPDSDPVMSWDNAPLTLGTLRKARALKREPNAAGQAGQNEFRTAPSIEVNSPFERVPQHDTKMTTDMELAGEIERYLAPDAIYYQWMPSMADMEQIIAALRQSALAQAEIKGHMRVEDDLKAELREANEAAMRWYMAASPYATPEALREALKDRA